MNDAEFKEGDKHLSCMCLLGKDYRSCVCKDQLTSADRSNSSHPSTGLPTVCHVCFAG